MTDGQRGSRALLLAGIPRSGTTWAMQVLETAAGVRAILEPDNEGISAPAVRAKRRAGRFPALVPGERDDAYRALWTWVLAGAPPSWRLSVAAQVMRGVQPPARTRHLQGRAVPLLWAAGVLAAHPGVRPDPAGTRRRLLVKSVHAPLSAGWLAGAFDLEVVVLLRHPGNVLASWLALDLNEQFVRLEDDPAVRDHYLDRWEVAPPGPGRLERMVFSIGVLTTALEEQARSAGWTTRTHEDLCRDPARKFRALFAELGLTWSDATEAFLADNDRAGEGFRTQRVAAELPEGWTHRLDAEQVAVLRRGLAGFPLRTWNVDDFSLAGG